MEYTVNINSSFCHVKFKKPVRILSSAIYNGGYIMAQNFLNLRVDENFEGRNTEFEKPYICLEKLSIKENCIGKTVGMMTAAEMKTFAISRKSADGIWIEIMLTAGLSNARRAGDKADYEFMYELCEEIGTINILIATNAKLSDAAMVECIMICTEAKVTVLEELSITSPISGKLCTGTGTDSVAIACNNEGQLVEYCGKHVLFGQLLAEATREALFESLN